MYKRYRCQGITVTNDYIPYFDNVRVACHIFNGIFKTIIVKVQVTKSLNGSKIKDLLSLCNDVSRQDT